jgi:hypothetical protein
VLKAMLKAAIDLFRGKVLNHKIAFTRASTLRLPTARRLAFWMLNSPAIGVVTISSAPQPSMRSPCAAAPDALMIESTGRCAEAFGEARRYCLPGENCSAVGPRARALAIAASIAACTPRGAASSALDRRPT